MLRVGGYWAGGGDVFWRVGADRAESIYQGANAKPVGLNCGSAMPAARPRRPPIRGAKVLVIGPECPV